MLDSSRCERPNVHYKPSIVIIIINRCMVTIDSL